VSECTTTLIQDRWSDAAKGAAAKGYVEEIRWAERWLPQATIVLVRSEWALPQAPECDCVAGPGERIGVRLEDHVGDVRVAAKLQVGLRKMR
jgi:hypothetical protein